MKIEKHKIVIPLLITLIAVYSAKGALYPEGTFISRLSLFSLLALSGYYFIKTLLDKKNKNLFYVSLSALLLLNIVGYIFTANYSSTLHFNQFAGILMALLPFYPFYYFSQKGYLKERHLILLFILIIPISIADFYYNRAQVLSGRPGATDMTNNVAYTFAFSIPYLFFIKEKKAYSLIAISIIIIFLLLGAKRGAILTGIAGIIFYFYFQIKSLGQGNKLKGYFILLLIIGLLSYFIYDFYSQNEYLVRRMEEMSKGNSSGRDTIYSNLFNAWYNSYDFKTLFFGRGFAQTLKHSGTGHYAHNDWLELLTSFGLFGVLIYIIMFYSATKFAFDRSITLVKRLMMISILTIWFGTTVFSMNYTSSNAMFQNILLAYLLSNYNIWTIKKKNIT